MSFKAVFTSLSIIIIVILSAGNIMLDRGIIGGGRKLILKHEERVWQEKEQEAIKKALLICYPKMIVKERSGKRERDIVIGVTEFEAEVYAFIFTKLYKKYGVDWETFAALIWVESRFNPTLTSNKDAKGLMQLLERTAKETSKQEGTPYVENHSVWVDLNALELGASYFCRNVVLGDSVDYERMYKGYVGGDNYAALKDPVNVRYVEYYNALMSREKEKIHYIFKGLISQ